MDLFLYHCKFNGLKNSILTKWQTRKFQALLSHRKKHEESKQVVLEVSQVETGNLGGGFTDFPYDLIGVETIRLIEE